VNFSNKIFFRNFLSEKMLDEEMRTNRMELLERVYRTQGVGLKKGERPPVEDIVELPAPPAQNTIAAQSNARAMAKLASLRKQ
jgi:hypothetical protein